MDRQIREAEFVLLICTEPYFKRVMGEETEGVGLGVHWEGNLVYQHFYNEGSLNHRFLPVVFSLEDVCFIPTPFQGSTYYCLEEEEGYDRLYMRLTGQRRVEKPPLGKRRSLARREVKTDPSMYITGPIDVDLWNSAKWSATFFMWAENKPPFLGLGFRNEDAARNIFNGWHERYGDCDEYEELRISIIEGDIEGVPPGYSVHIGSEPDAAIKRYRDAGFEVDPEYLMLISRCHRMNPPLGSNNLEQFKLHYRRSKYYYLIPGLHPTDGTDVIPILDLKIRKGVVHLRHVSEIQKDDLDSVVLSAEDTE